MHIPQSWQTFTELEQICLVPQNLINPGTSKPMIEVTQDTLVGAYLLTIQDVKIERTQINNLMMFSKKYLGVLPEPAGVEYGIEYWTGKQLYSLILPDITINQLKNVKIIRGDLTEGHLNEESLGSSPAGLIKQIYNAYGVKACTNFLNDTQNLITRWMMNNSFTISFGDSCVTKKQRMTIKDITNQYIEEANDIIKKAQHGVFANDLDDEYKGPKLEFEITKVLSKLTEKVKDFIFENISKTNNFYIAGSKGSGSKGSALHTMQTLGIVGQQDIWGTRIMDGFTERTLPHFSRNDVGPDAKGFVRHSFNEGLTPSEVFFHAMGGRIGVIDTAIKSVTGDTPIIIMENGIMQHINIGSWIDELLLNNLDKVVVDKSNDEGHEERELLELDTNIETLIPTTDLDGNVSWGKITHITRHNPSVIMYEIKTKGGRKVTVTDSHSLLIWDIETQKLVRMCASNINIGDFVPVTYKIENISNLDKPNIDLNRTFKTMIGRDIAILQFNSNGIYVDIDQNNPLQLNYVLDKDINIHNDIVLDSIIEINKVNSNQYKKVYDLTIPSTLNFGIANGLHVVDTADSGYLSRRLIKAAEDLMINYDMTVRNASGYIVQFGYGDDSIDPIKLEKVNRIELIEHDNEKMKQYYKFDKVDDRTYFENFMTPEAINEMMEDENYKLILNDDYEEMMQMRNDLRYLYFKNTEVIGDINTYVPINLYRVIPSQLIKFKVEPYDLSDLTPQYIIKTYNETMLDIIKYLPEKQENWKLFKIIFKSFLATKRVLNEYRMSKAAFDSIILLIKEKMLDALISPGEMVGIISAQTLGEISTQLTLNSVTYETEIIVRDSNKKITKHQIGEFIEREIRKSHKIEYMEDKDTTYAECLDYYEIPSCNEDGDVSWKRIEAVTKHPVINKDGSDTMLKITTDDERTVIATKAKSFLKLINGKILPIEGENLKVGDYLPVSIKQIDFEETFTLDLKSILLPNEYVYGSELEKAKSVMNEHHWWKNHSNKTFILPHNRSDIVVQLASKSTIKNKFVYMLTSRKCNYEVPEIIDLDYNFGYFIGAYCAKGFLTKHQISISNNDTNYYEPILELCKKWNITTKIYKKENKEEWTSKDLRIYNTILCKILENLCGKLSYNKFISDKIIYSNKECLKGFLDAYIGGNGAVNKSITMSSVSKTMLVNVQNILLSFDVFSHIHKPSKQETNNRESLDIKQIYILCVCGKQSKKLAKILDIKIDYKNEASKQLLMYNHEFEYSKEFEKIPNEIDGEIIMEDKDGRFIDTVFSKIKTIEEVKNSTKYAFDLTVEETRNFIVYNSIILRDTFHAAGSGALVITEGVPRLKEIINISKNLKSDNMTIYLKEEYALNKDNAKKIQSKFSYTQLKDLLATTEILYDNKNGDTDNNEDYEFIKSYREFTELFGIDNIDTECLSPWILRLIFDKESLMNRKITVQEIQESIKQNFHNDQEIECIFSDDSVNDIIMRIRIKYESNGNFLEFMKDFEKQLIELPLRGISNIKQVEIAETNIIKYNHYGSFEPSKEWLLKTSGSNLIEILAEDYIDITRTITNNIIEFYEIFGIEATRELIYRELYKVYAEKHPNPRHIQLFADIMTYRGKLMQIDRHGLNKNTEIGPIAKASFEEVMNIFTKASLFAEKDNMKGVSANILAGQFCKSGTNTFDLLIDEEKLLMEVDIPDYVESEEVDVNEKSVDRAFDKAFASYEQTDAINDDDFTFGFGMENQKEYTLEGSNTINTNVVLTNTKTQNIIVSNEFENVNIDEKESVFDNINIEEPLYEQEPKALDNSLNIDFESIAINEPIYEEQPLEEKSTKKIRIKKTKNETGEEKPKKTRVTKKK